ncbi:RNHCP domain-containing protein [bacterium]|nr:RNHCP domain-containing protein [bacterium]
MFPINYQIKNAEYKILFKCETCGKEHRNKRAEDDEIINLLTFLKK